MEESKISIVKNMIHKKFYFLEENYGYSSNAKEVKNDFFDESLHFNYSSLNLKRKICIVYNKSKVDDIDTYTFSLSITRLPYSEVKDFFGLYVYFRSKGIIFSNQLKHNFNAEGAELILDKIAAFSMETDDIRKMIEGKKWLESYYPEWN